MSDKLDVQKAIDCDYTKEIVCPYCGYEHGDSWEWMLNDLNVDGEENECDSCGKKFKCSRDCDITYSTEKIKEVQP